MIQPHKFLTVDIRIKRINIDIPIAQYAVNSDATNLAVITKNTALEIGPKRDIKVELNLLRRNP